MVVARIAVVARSLMEADHSYADGVMVAGMVVEEVEVRCYSVVQVLYQKLLQRAVGRDIVEHTEDIVPAGEGTGQLEELGETEDAVEDEVASDRQGNMEHSWEEECAWGLVEPSRRGDSQSSEERSVRDVHMAMSDLRVDEGTAQNQDLSLVHE